MTVKGIVVTLSVVAVLGVVAAMAVLAPTATPTAAQGQPEQEETPPPPTPTPEFTSESDAKALDEMHEYCHDGEVRELEADVAGTEVVNGVEFKTVSLQWWSKRSYWDLPEGMVAYYRIQRQTHDKDDPTGDEWQTVDTVTNTDVWKGVVETGHWHYRVGLLGLVSGDLVHECQATQWAEAIINVLTPQEELAQHCETVYVYHIGATVEPVPDGQGETVTVYWELEYDYYQDYPPPPEGEVLFTYRLERKRSPSDGSEGNWEKVAEVSDMTTWNRLVEPGKWIYRVALVSLQAGDLMAQCEKPQWAETEVWVFTAEELAQEKNDRRILVEQLTTCATNALTTNLTPAAREVVGRHVEWRVAEITEDYGSQDMIPMVVMFCTDDEIFSGYISLSAQSYILSELFDEGYGW